MIGVDLEVLREAIFYLRLDAITSVRAREQLARVLLAYGALLERRAA